MIVTESVYQLINELCSSIHQAEQYKSQAPVKQSKLKTLKSRMHEILLKTSNSNNEAMDPHELYLHELECKMNGESVVKCSAMEKCCRLVERDEYFQTEIGQSIMTFLLKLRNTGKCSEQKEQSLPNYFFNSSLTEQSPYFFLPSDMLRFSEDMRGVLKFRVGNNVCEKSYFGIPVENQSNKLLINSSLGAEDWGSNRNHFKMNSVIESINYNNEGPNRRNNSPIDSTIIRCGRWDNLGQPMDYLNARFSSEVDCTNELLAIATCLPFEVKCIQLPQFIADIKLLLTGIPSDSFHFDEKKLLFRMEENLSVANISPETMASSVVPFLECGSCYRRLQLLLARNPIDFKHKFDGFVFKTLCTSVATFLMVFNQFVYTFDDTFIAQMLLRMSSMIQQIEILSQILGVHPKSTIPMEKALAVLPRGSEFLNYLYRKFVSVTQNDLAMLLFTILKECCTVYFKKFETWIFHGFIEDPYKELFIEFVDFYQPNTKHFWDKAYTIKRQSLPSFLLGCEDSALLCGKYTMLLKTIKPSHPFLTIPAPSIRVYFSHQQISELQDNCRKYIHDAQILCGPAITVRRVYQQKSMKRMEFRQRCAARFQENLQQWHEEQMLKRMKDKSNKEKHRKILEEQIEEIRERKIQKRIENLARDREYLRQQEVLENERIAEENVHRQKTLEYYEELGRIVHDQQQRVNDKIKKLSTELTEKSDGDDHDVEIDPSPDDDHHNPNKISELPVETNMKKSSSDYFNSNDIPSEFTANKTKVMGSTIEFNDATALPRSTGAKTLGNQVLIDNHSNTINRDANSNELHPTLIDRQKNKTKVLQSEFDICPVVVKIDTTHEVSNKEFQKNQQKSGAHTDIFGNEVVDEFQRNRSRVLTEEFGYATTGTNRHSKISITPVDWKPIRTSMSLDFSSRNTQNDLDVPTPMSIDTPTIHEDIIEEVSESQLKIVLPRSEKLFQQSLETLDGNEVTPDSALNTCGILKKHGFVFETITESAPMYDDCYKLSFSPAAANKNRSFFALPNFNDDDNEPDDRSSNLNDLENVSSTTLGNFLKMSFAIPIHARLSILNNEILKIFLEDLDILSHLKSLRNFYFMMDGEFSSYISDGLITRLESTKSPTELFNFQFLHTILHSALNSSVYGNDQNADRLSFLITDVPQNFDLASPNVLRTLNLSYRTEWPLNLILTPEAMSHYANIFQHLLKLRRISWVLEQCYQILKEVGKTSTQNIYTSPQYRHVQQIRSKLLTFVNALQNHITSTALQGSWRAFKIDLESTKSIDDLYHKHAKYLKRVKFLCMLNRGSSEFFIKLEDVLIVILRFYYQLKQRSWRSNNTHPNFDKFLIIEKDFEKLVKFIIRIGSKISRCGYQTEIGDLINVINFNGFYDSNATVAT